MPDGREQSPGHARRLARYAVAGLVATAVHYALMASLLAAGWLPVSASTGGALAGALVAYSINRGWTFGARHSTRRMTRFLAVAALCLLLNAIPLSALHYWLVPSIVIAQLLTTAGVFVASYLINLKWSFA